MIVGFCGYARVGKDTAASRFVEYERAAFADRLKCEVLTMLKAIGIEPDFNNPEDKEHWRWLLVDWGAHRRSTDPDYWVKQLFLRIAPIADKRIMITDVRYPNEVAWIHKHGGLVIGIDRPGYQAANDEERNSISDINVKFDLPWIVNDGSPADLEKQIRKIVKQFHCNRMINGGPER